jgi:Spy/CpxP family protein refolding chaperone
MRTRTVRTIVGAAAAACVAALIVPVLAAAQEAKPGAPPRPERPARLTAREALGLTPEQEKSLAEFRKARAEERRVFREGMSRIREEMRGFAGDTDADRAKIDGLIDKAARLRAEHAKAAFRSRAERNRIFSPEQREKLKAFREGFARGRGLRGRGSMGFGRAELRGLARARAFRHRPFRPRWRDR